MLKTNPSVATPGLSTGAGQEPAGPSAPLQTPRLAADGAAPPLPPRVPKLPPRRQPIPGAEQAIDQWTQASRVTSSVRFSSIKKEIQQIGVQLPDGSANPAYGVALNKLAQSGARKGNLNESDEKRLLETAYRYSVRDRTPGQRLGRQLSVPAHLRALPQDTALSAIVAPQKKHDILTTLLKAPLSDPQARALLDELVELNVRQGAIPADDASHCSLMRRFFEHHAHDDPRSFGSRALPVLVGWLQAKPSEPLDKAFIEEMARQGRPLSAVVDSSLAARFTAALSVAPSQHESRAASSSGSGNEKGKQRADETRFTPTPPPDSSRVFLQATVLDDKGEPQPIMLRTSARRRIIASAGDELQQTMRDVLEQARSAPLTVIEPAVGEEPGQALFDVRIEGRQLAGILVFQADGRVVGVEMADPETFSTLMEGYDTGGVSSLGVSTSRQTSVSGSSAGSLPAQQTLTPPAGVRPRVDISEQVDSMPLDNGNIRYQYVPRPGKRKQHGVLAEVEPGGVLHLKLMHAAPEWRSTLGSGTDMLMGVLKRLNEDGVAVTAIRGKWINSVGVDSQFKAYKAAIDSGLPAQDAAQATFFGKQAKLYGLTRFDVERDGAGDYLIKFSR